MSGYHVRVYRQRGEPFGWTWSVRYAESGRVAVGWALTSRGARRAVAKYAKPERVLLDKDMTVPGREPLGCNTERHLPR